MQQRNAALKTPRGRWMEKSSAAAGMGFGTRGTELLKQARSKCGENPSWRRADEAQSTCGINPFSRGRSKGLRWGHAVPSLGGSEEKPCQRLRKSMADFSTSWQSKGVDAKNKTKQNTTPQLLLATRGLVFLVRDYSSKHQYTDTIVTPGHAPPHLISVKHHFPLRNSCLGEGSACDQAQERQRKALKKETGMSESFPSRNDLLKSRSAMWSARFSSSWTQLAVWVVR